jgi:hypothetical protein
LSNYFSEAALIRYRLILEIDYMKSLSGILPELEENREKIEALVSRLKSLTPHNYLGNLISG